MLGDRTYTTTTNIIIKILPVPQYVVCHEAPGRHNLERHIRFCATSQYTTNHVTNRSVLMLSKFYRFDIRVRFICVSLCIAAFDEPGCIDALRASFRLCRNTASIIRSGAKMKFRVSNSSSSSAITWTWASGSWRARAFRCCTRRSRRVTRRT